MLINHLFSSNKKISKAIKNICGFYPTNVHYYKLAFTHSSESVKLNGVAENYERLEFLGDSVLSIIISEFLYKRYPLKDEGFLSQMRSRIVSKESLAKISIKIGLESLLNIKLDNNRLQKSIREDVFEALLGAIYLDKGYIKAKDFLIFRVLKYYIDFDEIENTDTDYKSQFMRFTQKEKLDFEFLLVSSASDSEKNKVYAIDLVVNEIVLGSGTSFSKKKAEQMACMQALENPFVINFSK